MNLPPSATKLSGIPLQTLEAFLTESRRYLLVYVMNRVSDPHLAEDILQDSVLKALQAAPDLRDDEKLVPWFHRIMQRAIIDAHRKRERERKGTAAYAWALDTDVVVDYSTICLCFRALLPTLKEEYRAVIEAVELQEGDPDEVARELGITRNNLNVRLFRARRQLRQRLEAVCTACPDESYEDCDCDPLSDR